MKAITLRGIPDHLATEIDRRAMASGHSVSRTVVRMLEERLEGCQEPFRDLDFLIGAWTEEEWQEFEQLRQGHRHIDPEMWE